MYPRKPEFDQILVNSHRMYAGLEIWNETGAVVATTDRPGSIDGFIDGNMAAENGALIRRTCDFTLMGNVDNDILAMMFNPLYNVVLFRGLYLPSGRKIRGPLGVFTIHDYIQDDSGAAQRHRFGGSDLSYNLSEHKLRRAFSIRSSNPVEIIQYIVDKATGPKAQLLVQDFGVTSLEQETTYTFKLETDVWAKAQKLCESWGCELFFDPSGNLIMRDIPELRHQKPVWDFTADNSSTIMNVQQNISPAHYNYVAVISNNAKNKDRTAVFVEDEDPESDTYAAGPYGRVPYFIHTNAKVSKKRAGKIARAGFKKMSGKRETTVISAIPNPFFEIDDMVTLDRSYSDVAGRYLIEKISVPCVHDRPMYLTLKKIGGLDD